MGGWKINQKVNFGFGWFSGDFGWLCDVGFVLCGMVLGVYVAIRTSPILPQAPIILLITCVLVAIKVDSPFEKGLQCLIYH